jgi:hypothetical protein
MNTVTVSKIVPGPPTSVFPGFTASFGAWYPQEYTWSGTGLVSIRLGSREGDFCTEIGPLGLRLDWGRILHWDPPHNFRFSWQISYERVPVPDQLQASEVVVRFTPEGESTRLDLHHTHFERHGEDSAEAYAEAMGSQAGWPWILDVFTTWYRNNRR